MIALPREANRQLAGVFPSIGGGSDSRSAIAIGAGRLPAATSLRDNELDGPAEELLARAAAGEAVFCEHLAHSLAA